MCDHRLCFLFEAVATRRSINHLPRAVANQLIGLARPGRARSLSRLGVGGVRPVAGEAGGRSICALPGPMDTSGQMTLGVVDVCSAAGVLYVLLPHGHGLAFLAFCALYSFGCMLGIASHAPGGLGVFEATMLKGVGGPIEPLLASLLYCSSDLLSDPPSISRWLCSAPTRLRGAGVRCARRWRSAGIITELIHVASYEISCSERRPTSMQSQRVARPRP